MDGTWKYTGNNNQYMNQEGKYPGQIILTTNKSNIWTICADENNKELQNIINHWIKNTPNIDRCWFTKSQINQINDKHITLNNNGIITKNNEISEDEFKNRIEDISMSYMNSLHQANKLRNKNMAAFEINITSSNTSQSLLDLINKENSQLFDLIINTHETKPNFRRFRGIDAKSWSRVFIDVGDDHVYITIPKNGSLNTIPRMASIIEEIINDTALIYHDGNEIFNR